MTCRFFGKCHISRCNVALLGAIRGVFVPSVVLLPMIMEECQPAYAHFLVLVRFKINWDQLYNLDGSRIYVAASSETIYRL